MWLFDRVLNFNLADAVQKELNHVGTRQECERACLREQQFRCASANYFAQNQVCQMSSDSRRTQPKSFVGRRGVDYLENHCVQGQLHLHSLYTSEVQPQQVYKKCLASINNIIYQCHQTRMNEIHQSRIWRCSRRFFVTNMVSLGKYAVDTRTRGMHFLFPRFLRVDQAFEGLVNDSYWQPRMLFSLSRVFKK